MKLVEDNNSGNTGRMSKTSSAYREIRCFVVLHVISVIIGG